MANPEHFIIIKQGVDAWNKWREQNPEIKPDLSEVDFSEAYLSGFNLMRFNLSKANFSGADLRKVNLFEADLSGADLSGAKLPGVNLEYANLHGANLHGAYLSGVKLANANLIKADLSYANLGGYESILFDTLGGSNLIKADLSYANLIGANFNMSDLREANLKGANLSRADFSEANLTATNLKEANLSGVDLSRANMVGTNFEKASLNGCRIYGISAWNLNLKGTIQSNLIITPENETTITVDNLEVAQFIYLLLNNEKLRDVIDTITSKTVLILGSFTPERKAILDAIKKDLRNRNYLPILFDFEKPSSRNLTETITLLARMARFIIADITDAKSIPQELYAIVPHLPSVPVKPLLISSQKEYGMFESFRGYPCVLETYYYDSIEEILASIKEKIINPAEEKARELSPTISHR